MSREVKTADVLAGALRSDDVAGVSTAADFTVLDAEYADDLADAILAADPRLASALELGLAWLDVVDALPEDWECGLDGHNKDGWRASASHRAGPVDEWDERYEEQVGPTPAAALRALHDRLQSRGE